MAAALLFVCFVLSVHCALLTTGAAADQLDFVTIRQLDNGQQETIVASGEIKAVEIKQTTGHLPGQLYVHQMTNGQEHLLLIYKGQGNLEACERGHKVKAEEFLREYFNGSARIHGAIRNMKSEDAPDSHKDLVNWIGAQKACARLHRIRKLAAAGKDSGPSSRSRRALSIIVPGTTWCGTGNVSRGNDRWDGVHIQTDRCCRTHDLCNYTIESFSRKYNLLNFRFHTISHCECDDQFRTCLLMSNDENSNMVGRLFFNVLQMKCFTLNWQPACLQRAWWGKCERWGQELSATVRDGNAYPTQ